MIAYSIDYVSNSFINELLRTLVTKNLSNELSDTLGTSNIDDLFVLISTNVEIKHTRIFGLLYRNQIF